MCEFGGVRCIIQIFRYFLLSFPVRLLFWQNLSGNCEALQTHFRKLRYCLHGCFLTDRNKKVKGDTMKNEVNADFKFLEIPNGEDVLGFLGSEWIREYGRERSHFHNLMEISICRWGFGNVILDKKSYPFKEGDVLVVPRNYPHNIINTPGEKAFWESIYIKPSVFLAEVYREESRKCKKYIEEAEQRPFVKSRTEVPNLSEEINLLMNQLRVKDYQYHNCIRGLLFAMLMEIIKINHRDYEDPESKTVYSQRRVKTLGKALEFIEENYWKDLRISEIAQAAFVSETCLRRLFAEYCAMSPLNYLKTIRIYAAREQIKNTDETISAIAYKVGFTNMSTFINNFKGIVGCTPHQWRQNIRQKAEKR